jgi:hypothetical protein
MILEARTVFRGGDVDRDLVALPEARRLDHGGERTSGQAVSPFADLHMIHLHRLCVDDVCPAGGIGAFNPTGWTVGPGAGPRFPL